MTTCNRLIQNELVALVPTRVPVFRKTRVLDERCALWAVSPHVDGMETDRMMRYCLTAARMTLDFVEQITTYVQHWKPSQSCRFIDIMRIFVPCAGDMVRTQIFAKV